MTPFFLVGKLVQENLFCLRDTTSLFCAAVGTGNQLIVLTVFHLALAYMGVISTFSRRGSILAGVVVLYCLFSGIGGFTAVRLFRKMNYNGNNKNWVNCVLWTAGLFPAPVVLVFLWTNTIALAHGSTNALPFTALQTCLALYILISFPMTVLGGTLAKNYYTYASSSVDDSNFNAPTTRITTEVIVAPRESEIPTRTEMPWYRSRAFQVLIVGFLPFSCIYIELQFIFGCMWGHLLYTLFGILLLNFILLVILTCIMTVLLLYLQLASEGGVHMGNAYGSCWWVSSFVNGGMTGVFIYAYSFYFYFYRSGMKGLLQGSFYFGYMAIVSFGIFLMLGSAGFQSSLVFVRYAKQRALGHAN
jgi:hypothetical protein